MKPNFRKKKKKKKKQKKVYIPDWLIDFNGISNRRGIFYA